MKIFYENKGYVNSLFILLIAIVIIILLLSSVLLSSSLFNMSVDDVSANVLESSTNDFILEINTLSMESIHNLSYMCISRNMVLDNSTRTLKSMIQSSVNNLSSYYYSNGIFINCSIINVYPSDDPFMFDVYYRLNSSFVNDSSKSFSVKDKISVSLVDINYPVYDMYPLFRGNVRIVNNSFVYSSSSSVYHNAVSGLIIKKCPYDDYVKHGHSNITLIDCLKNHFYHFSHDGLCIFCRMENKSECFHNGLETFIVPSVVNDSAVVSVDHVYFNVSGGNYSGKGFIFNDSYCLYLDNGHRSKYGL